jgi:hypothetical protein
MSMVPMMCLVGPRLLKGRQEEAVTPITSRSNQSSARCGEKPRDNLASTRVIEDSRPLRLPWPDTRDDRTGVKLTD